MMNSMKVLSLVLFVCAAMNVQAGVFTPTAWTDDADLPFSAEKEFTHVVDIADADGSFDINGVTVTQVALAADMSGTDAGSGKAFTMTTTSPWLTNGAIGPAQVSGTNSQILTTGLIGNGTVSIVLEGLQVNTHYAFTVFNPSWDGTPRKITLDGSDDGLGVGAEVFTQETSQIIEYVYNTGNSTSFAFDVTVPYGQGHFYSFANEEFTPTVIIEPVSPINGTGGVKPSEVELTWQEKFTNSDNLTFDVYLDPNEIKVANLDAAVKVTITPQTGFSYNPDSELAEKETYYWRVVGYEGGVAGDPNLTTDMWSFTTGYKVSHWELDDWTNDADSQIALGKNYTHAVNFNSDEASSTVVNRIVFENDSDRAGANWTLATSSPLEYSGGSNVIGDGAALVSSFFYSESEPPVLTLTGLTPGENYILTLYTRGWGNIGDRPVNVTTSDDGRTEFLDQNIAGDGNGHLFKHAYTAPANGELVVEFVAESSAAWHHYAFSNEVDEPYIVSNPLPGGAINYDDVLSWSLENSEIASPTYNVTVATDANLINVVEVASDLTAATFNPILDPDAEYYWQVEVEDGGVLAFTGPVWDFITHPADDAVKVLEWKFEDGLGATVEQTGSSDNADGVLVGFADPNSDLSMSVTGLVGQALELNGQGEFVDVSAANPYMPTGDGQYFAVSGYFRTFGDYGPLFSMRSSTDDIPLIDVTIGHDGVQIEPGKVCLIVRDNNGSISWTNSGITVNDGRWHSFIVTRALNEWKLYIDGAEVALLSGVATGEVALDELAIGSSIRWQQVDYNSVNKHFRWFDGQLDEYTIWSGILQPAQIEALVSIVPPQGDIDFDLDTDIADVQAMAQSWLADSMTPVQADVVLEDMESYDAADPNSYNTKWIPVEADGLGTTTLIPQVDPNDAGNTVMRLDFDFAGQQQIQSRFWLLEDRVDFAIFDQFKIRIRVLPGTDADVFFMNIFDGRELVVPANEDLYYKGQIQVDLSQVPVDQWIELMVEIPEDEDFAGTANGGPLTCHDLYRFTVAAYDEDSAGSGSVLIDTIELVDMTENCVVEVGALIPDFNGDCLVNLLDYAKLAENWMAGL